MLTQIPINESVRQIDTQTWLLGNRLLLSCSSTPTPHDLWTDGRGSFYSISEAPEVLPASRPLPNTSLGHIRLVHEAGDTSAVWEIGNAFLKVKLCDTPSATREHVTLAALRAKCPSFAIPEALYHTEWDGRYYLILSKLPGQTLTKAWPKMDEAKRVGCVERVVGICNELAEEQADYIGGVDRKQLPDSLLIKLGKKKDFSHENLLKNCVELGLDCSTFVFFHCDLGPGNIIIDQDDSIGVIDWEMAGFVPKEWIRTRFCVAEGLNLPGSGQESVDWRRRVQKRLSTDGYPEIADGWMAWWKAG